MRTDVWVDYFKFHRVQHKRSSVPRNKRTRSLLGCTYMRLFEDYVGLSVKTIAAIRVKDKRFEEVHKRNPKQSKPCTTQIC